MISLSNRLGRLAPLAFCAVCLLAVPALAAGGSDSDAAANRDAALKGDTTAWDIIEGLTTEIGPRLAATDQESRARAWAVDELTHLGFKNVHIEPFDMPLWLRGVETAEIVSPFPQKLVIAALGNSSPTPDAGITAEMVAFEGLAALSAAPEAAVKGKIVFVTHHMAAQQDGGGYAEAGPIRFGGPAIAAKKGALAIVIRSAGTDHHRVAHTGVTVWPDGVKPIPAAAMSVPDAEQLSRILARGKIVTLHLTIGAHMAGTGKSGNVVAEVPGRDPNAGIILIGGHLDSWDLGTGATDDAAGIAIVTAAAKRIMEAGQPLRTIRVVWFGAEEPGGFGGKAYAKAHSADTHVLTGEADFGADRVWSYATKGDQVSEEVVTRLGAVLAPLGITHRRGPAHGGTDIEDTAATGVPIIDLTQDGTHYFDTHHTPDDTLDKIDLPQLRQSVAAWTAMLTLMANESVQFQPAAAGTR
jgi:hypothetical protein